MRRVEKPWGHELIWAETDRYVGKVLHIKAGHSLSRQYHERKEETFLVQTGEMNLEIGPADNLTIHKLTPGKSFHCVPKTIHRMVAVTDVDVVEVSTPELDDVVRLEDAYGREGTNAPLSPGSPLVRKSIKRSGGRAAAQSHKRNNGANAPGHAPLVFLSVSANTGSTNDASASVLVAL